MLARLQKRLDEQEAEAARERQKWLDKQEVEAAHERVKATLNRDAAKRVHNQLLARIEVLRRAQTRGSDEDSCTHPSQPSAIDTVCTEAVGDVADSHPTPQGTLQ